MGQFGAEAPSRRQLATPSRRDRVESTQVTSTRFSACRTKRERKTRLLPTVLIAISPSKVLFSW
jgi:hypothetical protein